MISYHFSILRYVHDVSTEEFANIGVAMLIPERSQLNFRANERFGRLSGFFKDIDGPSYRQMIRNLENAYREIATAYQFQDLPSNPSQIFSEIIREDASCFQWSQLMSGISDDAETRFAELYAEFVTYQEASAHSRRRSETNIWRDVRRALRVRRLDSRVEFDVNMAAQSYQYSFKMGWNNGRRQVLEPISFALKDPATIVDKANTWIGRLFNLSKDNTFGFTAVVATPEKDKMKAFNDACHILNGARSLREIITEDQVDDFMDDIQNDLPRAEVNVAQRSLSEVNA